MVLGAFIGDILSSLRNAFRFLAEEPRYLVYALLVHAGFLLIFVLSFEWTTKPFVSQPEVNVVQATVVDESAVQQEIDKLREAEARKQAEEEARLRRQREEAQRAEQQRKQAEEARKREEQRLAETKRQEEQARRKIEEQRKAEVQRKVEEERKAEVQRKQAEEQRKVEEQRAAEQRKQEEARRVEEQKRAAEAARVAEEQRRKDEQAAAERARREQSEVERYVEVIRQQVERNWNRPPKWTTGIRCTVRVNLIPGGDVVDVRIVRSCGDPLFDTSVEHAVRKASPLRVPPADTGLFDRFRELEFVFNPQG